MLLNMKELLKIAQKNKFAVPAFNISSFEILKAVIESAEKLNAPVICEVHPMELDYVGDEFIETIKKMAINARIPVVIHLDHGANIQQVIRAIQCGFTSVMIDGSTLPYELNVDQTQQVVELAEAVNVSVEAELGTIGNTGVSFEGGTSEIIYTDPKQAIDFVKRTGIDTLAIAIGTAHGLYPKNFNPQLNLELLKQLASEINIPLVLHGGSGNPDDEIARAVELGICKINISSDIKSVFFEELKCFLEKNENAYEPSEVYPTSIMAAKAVIEHKFKLLNTVDKANLY